LIRRIRRIRVLLFSHPQLLLKLRHPTNLTNGETEMESRTFKDATRIQLSLLAPLEKKCLIWLARRLPSWIHSDHLTSLGFVAMFLAGLSYWLARWNRLALLLATFWLVINWFGDSLDGTLARVRNRQRPRYGFYVDHVIDTFGALFLIAGMALSGYMSWPIALGLLIAFFMLSIEVYLATYTLGAFRLAFCGVSPTEMRLLIAVGNVTLLFHPIVYVRGQPYRLFDVAGVVAIVVMGLVLIASVVRNTITLYRAERLREA
jgi:phosphatidylglycerophosphate synthase